MFKLSNYAIVFGLQFIIDVVSIVMLCLECRKVNIKKKRQE